jgi:Domain of unknown function (DUF1887)
MSVCEFDKYKVDHLFLLIGENPLPNYVVAKLLLKEGGKLYLVHSTDTVSKADCLQRNLKDLKIERISLSDKEADCSYIREKIQEQIKKIPNSSEQTFGLNYTGGTKAMSVHGYRALFEASQVHNPIFSYLDARTLQMRIEKGNETSHPEPVTLQVKLEELFNLHDLPWKTHKNPTRRPVLHEVAQEFLNAFLSTSKDRESIAKQWWEWCKEQLHPQTKNERGFWYDEETLLKIEGISLDGVPENIEQILYKYNMLNSTGKLDLKVCKDKGFSELSDVCAWLSGIWLEHYVLHQIQNISKTNPSIHESAMSFHIDDPKNTDDRYDRFEFDVAFMRDYQLFALSCTTAGEKSTCKQKLFEAHLRAKQLGGDEARVALVCFHHNSDTLKRDLEVTVRDKKIAVFGSKDLKPDKFTKKLQEWISDNSPVI